MYLNTRSLVHNVEYYSMQMILCSGVTVQGIGQNLFRIHKIHDLILFSWSYVVYKRKCQGLVLLEFGAIANFTNLIFFFQIKFNNPFNHASYLTNPK